VLLSLQGLQQAADKVGVKVAAHEVNSKKELALLLENLPEGTDALFLCGRRQNTTGLPVDE
jgi:hypothetical protein